MDEPAPASDAASPANAAGLPPGAGPFARPASRGFVLLLALAFAAAGTVAWFDMRDAQRSLRTEVAKRLTDADTALAQSKARDSDLANELREAQAKLALLDTRLGESQTQQASLDALYRELAPSRDELALNEVEQVLSLASQQLAIAGNVQAALAALQLADAKLSRYDRPQLVALRRALARDIDKLKSVPYVDVAGMSLKLDQVIGTIDLGELPGVQYWYPPTRWQPGETIKMEISDMPWWTGQFAKYGVALGVLGGDDPWERGARLLPQVGSGDLAIPLADDKTLAELMSFRTDPGGMPMRSESRTVSELPSGAVRQGAVWANGAELLGFRLADKSVRPGDELGVTLYWRTQQPLDKDYKVFVHVVRDGQVVAQHDAEPGLAGSPTSRWRAGEVVTDWHPIQVPPEAPAGSASVVVGLYYPASGARVPLAQGGDSLQLSDTVTVK